EYSNLFRLSWDIVMEFMLALFAPVRAEVVVSLQSVRQASSAAGVAGRWVSGRPLGVARVAAAGSVKT
ncbi:MAG: hypothetical protein EBT56_15315, partial [Betaproteobacteria bacterium]|nr:hypothetical protein [Betaproteobacteria bacterium]